MVRIPPDRLDEDIGKGTMELAHQAFEGRMGPDQKLVVLITNLELTGDSRVVHGDGAVYQPVKMDMLLFDIKVQDVVEGVVEKNQQSDSQVPVDNIETFEEAMSDIFFDVSINLSN